MQGFCKPQSSAQARKEAPDFNGVRSIKVMSWFVKPPKRGQYPSYTPIFNGLVVKMDISHNTTNVEFGVQVPTRLPILIWTWQTSNAAVSKTALCGSVTHRLCQFIFPSSVKVARNAVNVLVEVRVLPWEPFSIPL